MIKQHGNDLRYEENKHENPIVARHRSREQLYKEGKALRDSCSRASHAEWKPPADRVDPIELLEASNKGRLPELIPVRYGRMIPSPFVFSVAQRRSWQPTWLTRRQQAFGSSAVEMPIS
jgi:hypothetical protein